MGVVHCEMELNGCELAPCVVQFAEDYDPVSYVASSLALPFPVAPQRLPAKRGTGMPHGGEEREKHAGSLRRTVSVPILDQQPACMCT